MIGTIHASALVVGEACVLIRGPSGAGKSALALALMDDARKRSVFAALVGDDRISLRVVNGRLIASGHPAVQGQIERRWHGIVAAPAISHGIVRLVVDLIAYQPAQDQPPRLPQPEGRRSDVAGILLPRLSWPAGKADSPACVAAIVADLHDCASNATQIAHFACQVRRDAQNGAP